MATTSVLTGELSTDDFAKFLNDEIPNYVQHVIATSANSVSVYSAIVELSKICFIDCSELQKIQSTNDKDEKLRLDSPLVTQILHSLKLAIIVHKDIINQRYSDC